MEKKKGKKKRPAETRMVKTDVAEVVNIKKKKKKPLMVFVRKADSVTSLSLSHPLCTTNIYEVFGEVKVQLSDART